MKTRTGFEKILRRIMDSSELTEDMEKDIQDLRDDFDKREGELRRYGEVYDGEDKDDFDYSGVDLEAIEPTEGERAWRDKYNELKTKYIDRFFGGTEEQVEDIMNGMEKETERDGKPQTFEELLERVEG